MAVSATAGVTVPRDEPDDTELFDRDDPRGHRRASAPLVPRDDRYTLGEVIGKGGMGEVLAAHDEQIGRDVAIKRMRRDQPNATATARFLREARIQGRLEHPAIP